MLHTYYRYYLYLISFISLEKANRPGKLHYNMVYVFRKQ